MTQSIETIDRRINALGLTEPTIQQRGGQNQNEILVQLQAITGDDRYRPSQWLRRRAQLGLSATTVE